MISLSFGNKNSGNGYKSNVMYTLSWFFGVIITLLIIVMVIIRNSAITSKDSWLIQDCLNIIKMMLGFYACFFFYFMIRDPSRLQSEGYNLEQQAMALSPEKEPGEFNISPTKQPSTPTFPSEYSNETNIKLDVTPTL